MPPSLYFMPILCGFLRLKNFSKSKEIYAKIIIFLSILDTNWTRNGGNSHMTKAAPSVAINCWPKTFGLIFARK